MKMIQAKSVWTKIVAALLAVVLVGLTPALRVEAKEYSDLEAYQAVFNASYYAKNNPDVVLEYGKDANVLLMHYMQYGIKEGRNASADFNATVYRNRYADLNAKFGDNWVEYCRHYVTIGKAEGRSAKPDAIVPAQATMPAMAAPVAPAVNTNGYQVLGSYTTKYSQKQARATNIALAAAMINGKVVQPGEMFSFTNTVGPRTPERGFVVAPVYVSGTVSSGVGGGICQVSSTLYAAMLTVGLPATERHAHSLPVHYLPAGWDATISGTTLDLKFVNIYQKPLMITTATGNGAITVTLWLKQ